MTMGADLVILAVDETRGCLRLEHQLGIALAAADLVELARLKRIELSEGTLVPIESARTGDPVLDDTLIRIVEAPKMITVADMIRLEASSRVQAHVEAMINAGELEGRMTRVSLNAAPRVAGLRLKDPARRARLVKKLSDAVRHESSLETEAFLALAQAADIPTHVLQRTSSHRLKKDLKPLLTWFTDTWRYLPGVAEELALGDDDLEDGDVNPLYDEPWRLLTRLAVSEALKTATQTTRKSESENGLSNDVRNAALLAYAWEHGL